MLGVLGKGKILFVLGCAAHHTWGVSWLLDLEPASL